MRRITCAAICVLSILCSACRPAPPGGRIRLATTTSLCDTGLLDALLPAFTAETGIGVDVLCVGTGKAIRLAENGDVDCVIAHSPEAEERFLASGRGADRRFVMENDFVIVGPADDPAGAAAAADAAAALRAIARAGAPFVSRGDDSGTHARERAIREAGGAPAGGPAYLETGQGMGATLIIAGEKRAYCLADRATHRSFAERTGLVILSEGDPALVNRYHVITAVPGRDPRARAAAGRFNEWLASPAAGDLIGRFPAGAEPLFRPAAVAGAPS
ncbi:MAG: substrate-binding domain-containing protein [bacterium]|nr:substrate-binding domain-containing protein [bacterium]